MINAVSIVTPAMIGGIERQLEKGVKKIVVILDEKDGMSEEAIKEKFGNVEKKRFKFDAEYSFLQSATLHCKKVVFLQNNFYINTERILKQMDNTPANSASFSLRALVKDKLTTLKDLRTVDLSTVSQNEISAYVFVFDPVFLHYITPLNFAYYNKFLLEEMLIFPIVALLQKSSQLQAFTEVVHAFDMALVQFKEFVL